MARYTGSKTKRARRLGLALTDKQLRIMSKRSFPPGQHGPVKGHPRLSEFGKQLKEKQKAKFIYGILEKQLKRYVTNSMTKRGDSSMILFNMLERRLDNVIFRGGLLTPRTTSRQAVTHGHFTVNGKKLDIPSYTVKVGDIIAVKEKSRKSPLFQKSKELAKNLQPSSWILLDAENYSAKVVDEPKVTDMTGEFDPKLIIEFYSK